MGFGLDQPFSPLGASANPSDSKPVADAPVAIDVAVRAPPTSPFSPVGRTKSVERQLPKFPAGLFERRDWDIGRDFGDLVEIGKGKDTIIYKGTCRRPLGVTQEVGKTVAIKVYSKNKVTHTKLRAIKREVAMMAFLERKGIPNIVHAYTGFSDDLNYYIVMEHCEGGDLLEWILTRGKALHERDALQSIVVPLLSTLNQMHALGIVHRDLKLENIFLGKDLSIKLGDFGLTMSMYQESAISPVGTVEYMAPEVLALPPVDAILNKTIDPKSIVPNNEKVDVWALGVTLFELVTGRLPFSGATKQDIKTAIKRYELAEFPRCVSIGCRNLILSMLAYKADERPSCFQIKRMVNRFLAGESPTVQPTLEIKQGSSNDESQTKMEVDPVMSAADAHMSASPQASVDSGVEERRGKPKTGLGGFGRVLVRKLSGASKKKLFPFS